VHKKTVSARWGRACSSAFRGGANMVPAFAFIRENPSYREGSEQYNRLSGFIVLISANIILTYNVRR
jgi:hypothetical protein